MQQLTEKLLKNLNNFADLGRQRAFELGNAYYYKTDNNEYWRKELPSGEIFEVLFEIEYDESGKPTKIIDTYKKRIN